MVDRKYINKNISENYIKKRFGNSLQYTNNIKNFANIATKYFSIIIDIESLFDKSEFETLLGYLNTNKE